MRCEPCLAPRPDPPRSMAVAEKIEPPRVCLDCGEVVTWTGSKPRRRCRDCAYMRNRRLRYARLDRDLDEAHRRRSESQRKGCRVCGAPLAGLRKFYCGPACCNKVRSRSGSSPSSIRGARSARLNSARICPIRSSAPSNARIDRATASSAPDAAGATSRARQSTQSRSSSGMAGAAGNAGAARHGSYEARLTRGRLSWIISSVSRMAASTRGRTPSFCAVAAMARRAGRAAGNSFSSDQSAPICPGRPHRAAFFMPAHPCGAPSQYPQLGR